MPSLLKCRERQTPAEAQNTRLNMLVTRGSISFPCVQQRA